MSFVPGYDWDVFVSYAWVDNQPANPRNEKSRWVNTLYQALETYLNKELGRSGAVRIFFDQHDLPGNEPLSPEIEAAAASSATLVVVLSKGYLNSEWCRQEREKFLGPRQRAGREGRVFVVLRDKLAPGDWQPRFAPASAGAELTGYPFFEERPVTGDVRVFGEPDLKDDDTEYFLRLQRLCRQLAGKLEALRSSPPQPSPSPHAGGRLVGGASDQGQHSPPQPRLYLAEATPDMHELRERLRTFLEQSDFRVVPVSMYHRDPGEFRQRVSDDLRGALAFVQVLGPYPSPAMPGLPAGYEGLQAACAQEAGVPVILGCRRELKLESIQDSAFKAFLTSHEMRITDSLEEFKQQLLAELRRLQAKQGVTSVVGGSDRYVAVAAPAEDAEPVAERLSQLPLSYDVLPDEYPLTDAAQGEDYDAFLVFYRSASPEWVRDRVRQCRRIVMSSKEAPPLCGVLLDPPPPRRVLLTRPPEFDLISSTQPDQFESFLDKVRRRRRPSER